MVACCRRSRRRRSAGAPRHRPEAGGPSRPPRPRGRRRRNPGGARPADRDGARRLPAPAAESAMTSAAIETVIFDLDGVIVDSEIWWDDVRRDFAAAHDRVWTIDDRTAVMGANSRQWSATMRERLHLDLPATEIETAIVDGVVERYRREGAPTIDGAVDAVR